MFERFTDRARRVVVLAQEESRRLAHDYIGTEHILLGLVLEGEGVAARSLQSLEISLEKVRGEVLEIVGRGASPSTGHIPFTPRAKKVLELSLREALQLGHNYIGTEHILLGLIREGEGVAAQVLQKLGADLNRVRQTVIQLLSDSPGGAAPEPEHVETAEESEAGEAFRWHQARRPPPESFPLCPSCRASLAEAASVKTRELEIEGEPPHVIKIAYCTDCGVTLGIKIL